MDAQELDNAIAELETRLERLRSLYEQYFLGLEKIPPAVARKDVDRRIWDLRRAKIRNTARRFKLQTIIQRYNTFQQYWQRILREIENGTYRRHVLRAERATIRREATTDNVAEIPTPEGQRQRDADQAADDLAAMLDSGTDLEQELQDALAEAAKPPPPRAKAPGPQSPPPLRAAPPPVKPPERPRLETLDLDMEGLESPATRGNLLASLGSAKPGAGQPPSPTPPRTAPNRPPAKAQAPGTAKAGPPRLGEGATLGRPPPRPLASGARAQPKPESPPVRPPPATAEGESSASRPVRPATKPTPAAGPKPAPTQAGLSEQRIQELHQRLVAAKLQTKEPGKVSVQGLTKSLRAAESKLRKQHKNRNIDFDVVIKDGRAVVKPYVR